MTGIPFGYYFSRAALKYKYNFRTKGILSIFENYY